MSSKNTKKSPIDENADANIPAILVTVTSAVLGVGCHTYGHIVSSIIVRFCLCQFSISLRTTTSA